MSQDIVADALNQMMNAIRARKSTVVINRFSKLLLSVLAIAKLKGYIKDYKQEDSKLRISLGNLYGCKAIKPRLRARVADIDKFIARYLPAKDLGTIILSTSQGLMTHQTAIGKNIGGSLVAYLY